jgi:Uri superfamily endonuclease
MFAAGSRSHIFVKLLWERLPATRKFGFFMQSRPGTYALILKSSSERRVEAGKLGLLHVRPGYYVYVGSAFGPGGLKARIAHHIKISERPHWHIDYLRSILHLNEVWYSYDSEKHEHQWADTFSSLRGATIPMTGFGASDCSCISHLFAFTTQPSIRAFRRRLHPLSKVHESVFHKNEIYPGNKRQMV